MGTDTTRNETRERLTEALFADDATIFIQMAAALLAELEQADREARKKDKEAPLTNVSATSLLQQALRDAGMAENVGKRAQANLATLSTKNLGAWTDPTTDIKEKKKKAWASMHSLKGKISGMAGLTNTRRGELTMVMLRSVLTYGLQSRAVSDEELQELAAEESLMLSQLLDVSFADRVDEDGRTRLASLRRKAALPPFAVHVRFLQAKFLGHTMRRPMTELAKAALVGEFVLDAEGGGGADARGSQVLRTAESNRELEPSIRKVPSVVRDFRKHLQHCGIGDELAALLFEPQAEAKARRPVLQEGEVDLYTENKRTFYALTRKRFILDAAADWADDDDAEEYQAHADRLMVHHFVARRDKSKHLTRRQIMEAALEASLDPEPFLSEYREPRTGAEIALLGPKCIWCNKKLREARNGEEEELRCDPVDMLKPSAELVQHLREDRGLYVPNRSSISRKNANAANALIDAAEEERTRSRTLARADGWLLEVQQRGPKRKGHQTYVKKIRCVPCGINYTSRSGAMLEHLQAHQRDDYVFIYGIKGPNYKTDGEVREYRPEQHTTRGGKPFAGSDAALLEIRPPANAVFFSRAENATFLRCRKCKKIKKPHDPKAKITKMEKGAKASLIHSVRSIQRHEKKCQINKKTENGSGMDGGAPVVVNRDSRDEENDADISSSEVDEI
eukprot:g12886.t1